MKDTLAEINELRAAGIIGTCAIGRAMGATFYLEPIATFDLDIFVIFEGAPLILTLDPIYDFLKARGHRADGDAMLIHSWPVQFLPAESALLREAVEQAREIDFDDVRFVGHGGIPNVKCVPSSPARMRNPPSPQEGYGAFIESALPNLVVGPDR